MAPSLYRLDENSSLFQDIRDDFLSDWHHAGKSATVRAVYHVTEAGLNQSYRGRRFNEYRRHAGGRYKTQYHGTRRACLVGQWGRVLRPCDNRECGLCGILNHSFKIPRICRGSMFGNGIYTTTVSSKADIFAQNHHIHSTLHAVLICRVVSNRPQFLDRPDNCRTRPDGGYDSVEAVLLQNGGPVRFPETIVYREDAIVPVGVMMYTRRGWLP